MPVGHPEKDGILVKLSDLVSEIEQRIERKAAVDGMIQHAEGLKVVDGIRGDPMETQSEHVEKATEEAP